MSDNPQNWQQMTFKKAKSNIKTPKGIATISKAMVIVREVR